MALDPSAGKPHEGGGLPGPPARHGLAKAAAPQRAPALPPALSTQPNALALLKALRRRWLPASTVGLLLAAALGAAAWFLVPPPKHTVRTLVRVPSKPWTPLPVPAAAPDLNTHQRNLVALLKSRFVLNAALRDPKIANLPVFPEGSEPVEWLEQEIKADFSLAPEILRIELSGDQTEELKALVTAIQKAFVREVLDKEVGERRNQLARVRELREKFERQLKEGRADQKRLEPMAGSTAPAARAIVRAFAQRELLTAEQELLRAQSELRTARAQLEVEQAREKGVRGAAIPKEVVDAQVGQRPAVKAQAAKVQGLEQQIEANLKEAARGEDEPLVRDLRQQLQQAREALAKEQEAVRPEVVEALRKKIGEEVIASRAALEVKIAGQTNLVKILQPDVERCQKRVKDLEDSGAKLDDLREDLGHVEELVKKLQGQEDALEVELTAPKRWELIEEAGVVHAQVKARQVMVTAGAAAVGLALVLLGVAWWEFRARRVVTADEVAQGLGMAVVGTLPDSTRRVPRRLAPGGASATAYGHALLTESVDATRTMLLYAARTESLQVVMITSAMPGEGKTSLSCHLAASLARMGLKTLLIDGDLRNPSAHRLFELPNEAGLSDLLRGEAQAAEVTQPTAVSGLSLIAAGQWDYQAAMGLAQDRTRPLLGQLRREYDFILIDSSPVLPVTDALLLGQSADAVIFSILRDVSRLPSVHVASQRLAGLGVRVLGAVVNGVSGDLYPSAYRYLSPYPRAAEADGKAPDAPAEAPDASAPDPAPETH
jgi:polysaccharide biosynthesis transport protein